MNHVRARNLVAVLLLAGSPALAEVKLIGTGVIPGTATDDSGLANILEDGVTPNNLIGGLGSAITYSGVGNLYIATPDRGPADGTTNYTDRAYVVEIALQPAAAAGQYVVTPRVVGTRLLRSEGGQVYTGLAAAFDPTNSTSSARLDPEGIRVASCGGSVYVSDEYGPFVYQFGPTGKRERALKLPNKFVIDLPSANPAEELTKNLVGRQSNRGMEGLAISPKGDKLYGIMQSALLQDGGLDANAKRVGTNNRLVEIDVATGAIREFLYVLDSKDNGVSEILAVNDHEFLVLERDGKVGSNAAVKKVVKIDITDATDIRGLEQLPSVGAPVDVIPVAKSPFLDLLDPAFSLSGPSLPEKFEGLAFGPDLPDGRHLLIVTTDNDFSRNNNSIFYVFAIGTTDLPDYEPQVIRIGHCPTARGEGSQP